MARHARSQRCKPRNRSGGRLARLVYSKSFGRDHWLAEVVRLRSQRPGLPSQLREPDWQPDIWEPIPELWESSRAYDAWRKFNDRWVEANLFLCKPEALSRRELRRLKKALLKPPGMERGSAYSAR